LKRAGEPGRERKTTPHWRAPTHRRTGALPRGRTTAPPTWPGPRRNSGSGWPGGVRPRWGLRA